MQDREKSKTANIRSAVKEQEKMNNRFLEALKYLQGWMDLTPVELPSKGADSSKRERSWRRD